MGHLDQGFPKCASCQGICEYIFVMATLKYTFFFLIKGIMFW